ncbi:diguanylate cyclase, partial [Candidatus Bipolaricaulota bacterium]|nr:diguanylate cyclase [Candidatus Bipolaricaulota bacterium]
MEEIFEAANINPSTLLNKTGHNILVVDKDGKIVFANETAEGNISEDGDNLLGDYLHSNFEYPVNCKEALWDGTSLGQSIDSKQNNIRENMLWKNNGRQIPVNCTTNPLHNEAGEMIGAIISLKDESAKKQLEEELARHQNFDRLTGLPNHFKFRKVLDKHLDQSGTPKPGAVFLLDIDRFKEVNNSFGFRAADNLLTAMAELLEDALSNSDTLARFGGDEFIVLSPDRTGDEAEDLVTEIMQAVRNHGFSADGTDLQAT